MAELTSRNIDLSNQYGVQLKTANKYCDRDIVVKPKLQTKTATSNGDIYPDSGYCGLSQVTVNVAGAQSFNISYSNGAPTDTSKLWIKSAEPTATETSPQALTDNQLDAGKIFIEQDSTKNLFTLAAEPVKITIGIKNIYKGSSNNTAELLDSYLYNGTNWINVNTEEVATIALNPPELSLNGSILTITSKSQNVEEATYIIYEGDTEVTRVAASEPTVDLSNYIISTGDHSISVSVVDTAGNESNKSAAITYSVLPQLATPELSLEEGSTSTIVVSNIDEHASKIAVYAIEDDSEVLLGEVDIQ